LDKEIRVAMALYKAVIGMVVVAVVVGQDSPVLMEVIVTA
jgi:hypothetical protein